MKKLMSICAFSLVLGSVTVYADEPKKEEKKAEAAPAKEEKKTEKASNNEVAVVKTTMGEMVLEFWPDVAPKTVENFKTLAKKGFYDGTAFHRIVQGFMIQGGDPLTKDPKREGDWGTGGPGHTVKAEFSDKPHQRGVLSMARSSDPHSAGSRLYICLVRASFLDRNYPGFGA